MGILSGFKKVRRRIRLPDGYKLLSFWTSSQTVEMDDGTTLEENKPKWDDKYTKTEIDNKFSSLETNIDWKESVNTFSDISTTYPNPQDGWTVNVKDTDYTYRYNGTKWVTISANAIPKATNDIDGLLSKEDHGKYDDASNKKHEHTNKAALDSVTSEKLSKWDTIAESNVTGVKGNAESSYRSGNVNLTPANIGALPSSGGTVTGNLTVNGTTALGSVLKMNDGKAAFNVLQLYNDGSNTTYGAELIIGAGGNTFIGGGESPSAVRNALGASTAEHLHLTSDNDIMFDVNCNTIANRLQVVLDRNRNFYPSTTNKGSIGTATYKWADMYATTFHGTLYGGASVGTNPIIFNDNRVIKSTWSNGIEFLRTDVAAAGFAMWINTGNGDDSFEPRSNGGSLLGSGNKKWKDVYTKHLSADNIGKMFISQCASANVGYSTSGYFVTSIFGKIFLNENSSNFVVSSATSLKIVETGTYIVNVELILSATNNTANVKRLRIFLNGADAGFFSMGRISTWETLNISSPLKITTANSTLDVRFQDESGGGTIYTAKIHIARIE